MGVNSLPKSVTRQRRGCDLNPGPSAPECSTLTTRLPSHPGGVGGANIVNVAGDWLHLMQLISLTITNAACTAYCRDNKKVKVACTRLSSVG